jgi:putative ABC transport system permease protein
MLKNYLKSALRSIRRSKLYSLINIVGLSIGLAAAIVIGLWVQNEFSYDRYNLNADMIFRVTSHWVYGNGEYTVPWTAGPLADALKQLPQVKYTVRLSMPQNDVVLRHQDKMFNVDDFFYADKEFFKMFTLKFLEGNPETALLAPYSIVLTKSIAARFFPNSDPIGKVVNIGNEYGNNDFTVSGVIDDYPQDSHFHANCLASFSSIEKSHPDAIANWHNLMLHTYFMLTANSTIGSIQKELPGIVSRNLGKWGETQKWSLGVQRLTDIHLYSHLLGEIEPNRSIDTVLIFSAIGLFVLIISLINFISLSTARFSDRAKEVGVRKVVGAGRNNLMAQFFAEAILMTILASFIAVAIVELALPYFNNFASTEIALSLSDLLAVAGAAVLIGIVAGFYPAIFLSSFGPSSILRKDTFLKPAGVPMRKVLVSLQFTIAVGIIISTIIASQQLGYVKTRDIGFDKENVIVVPLRHDGLREKYRVLQQELSQVHGVESVSGASGELGNTNFISNMWKDDKPLFQTRFLAVDYGFLKTMGMNLISGRDFSSSFPSDTAGAILVNEAAAEKLRAMDDFNDELSIGGVYDKARVIGVVKNFNYRPLYFPVQPLAIFLRPGATRFMVLRLSNHNLSGTINDIEDSWKKIVPDYPLDWKFQDQELEKRYRSDMTMASMFKIGAFLSMFISVLGLFGLANFAVEKRVKEIGIRRVLGASITDITGLLSKDFVLLIVIGSIVACPLAYFFIDRWLQSFAYRVDVTIWPFLLSTAIALGVAVVTVSLRTIKAATANPIESLRYE